MSKIIPFPTEHEMQEFANGVYGLPSEELLQIAKLGNWPSVEEMMNDIQKLIKTNSKNG